MTKDYEVYRVNIKRIDPLELVRWGDVGNTTKVIRTLVGSARCGLELSNEIMRLPDDGVVLDERRIRLLKDIARKVKRNVINE